VTRTVPLRRPPTRRPGQLSAYLELLRPANVATSLADVLAGTAVAASGSAAVPGPGVGWLLAATACLYAGGIVLNDVFDREVDTRERPERPIPSGRVTVWQAAALGATLLVAGIAAGLAAGPVPAAVAAAVAVAVVAYDAWGKRHPFIGPVNMGLCRALNLMLGVAIVPSALAWAWPLGLLPLTYIAAVTMVSRGEVHGGKRPVIVAATGLVCLVGAALVGVVLSRMEVAPTARGFTPLHHAWALALCAWLLWRVIPAFLRAVGTSAPADVRNAVRTGVLSLVLLDAVIAASYAGIMSSLAVLATGLLAWWLARLFAVT
jgi:4-hydroxybenzoate polyprenyltransferase